MVKYWVKTPLWLKLIFPKHIIWEIPSTTSPVVYLTFDDGPHPIATPFAIDQLKRFDGKATFFCIGKNVRQYPEIYNQLIGEGHLVANHTFNHVNGWKTPTDVYLQEISETTALIPAHVFRPPYGRISNAQVRGLRKLDARWKIYMWDVLSADFDINIGPEQCLQNVLRHIRPGSIVIFHDSEKAWPRMQYALPRVLEFCQQKGWALKTLPQ